MRVGRFRLTIRKEVGNPMAFSCRFSFTAGAVVFDMSIYSSLSLTTRRGGSVQTADVEVGFVDTTLQEVVFIRSAMKKK